MPLYQCLVPAGSLNADLRAGLANAVTTVHVSITGAPRGFVNVLPTRDSFDLAHRLPNTSLRIYPDAGHGGVFQCHEKFVPQVLEFLT